MRHGALVASWLVEVFAPTVVAPARAIGTHRASAGEVGEVWARLRRGVPAAPRVLRKRATARHRAMADREVRESCGGWRALLKSAQESNCPEKRCASHVSRVCEAGSARFSKADRTTYYHVRLLVLCSPG